MELKEYIKDGNKCLMCIARKKLIRITPEELVRQNFIKRLISEFDVPRGMIGAEVPLSHFKKGASGRADIVVFGALKEEDVNVPLMVIECKEPSVPITDKVGRQVVRYDSVLKAKIIIVTNGSHAEIYHFSEKNGEYLLLPEIPPYKDLLENDFFEPEELETPIWNRPDFEATDKETIKEFKDYGYIGEDSKPAYFSLIINMLGLIFDPVEEIKNLALPERKFIEDGGMRYTTFGNASGGGFPGDYRYFILETASGETQIISFTVMGKLSAKNHPLYGNSKGYTLLLFAIDDFENSHLSLEYAIDRFVTIEGNSFSFWHDGTLTLGKKGRVKNKEVLSFIANRNPDLIKEDKVFLGQLDNARELRWNQDDVQNLISNFITYSFLRDEFRYMKK